MNARKVLNGVLVLVVVLAAMLLVNDSSAAQLAPTTTGVIATINVGFSPRGVAVNANTNRVYVANSISNSVSVIDGASNMTAATISVGTYPYWQIAVNPVTNRIYVPNNGSASISVINGATNSVMATISGLGSAPEGVAVHTGRNQVYATYGGSTFAVIDGQTNSISTTVNTGTFNHLIGVNPATDRAYVGKSVSNQVAVIDLSTAQKIADVNLGTTSWGIDINVMTNRIYVANDNANTVKVIDGATNSVLSTISVGSGPLGLAVNSAANCVYVANSASNTVSIINGSTNTVVGTVNVGTTPDGIAVNSVTGLIYVSNRGSNTVSVIRDETCASTHISMLDITIFAGDTPGSLPTQYEPLYQQLRQSALADPTKTIVGVFDLAGPSDTHIIVFQGATETLIAGLPDATGTLSATLREYNMTAAADLGGFLKWALATYAPGDIPVAVHYIGHGNFLAPMLDDLSRVFPNLTRNATAANSIFPLPSRIDSNPNLTDEHPRALFAPQAFTDALNFATGGQRRIAVLDLVHCYAGALEELYSLAPYADRLLASPFYTYWSPAMTGAALAALHGAQTPQQMADAILSAYHQTLLAADDPATTWIDHPHLLIALDPTGMDNLKNAWDHVSDYLLQAWSDTTRARLLAAYQAAPVYDTTFCRGDFACAAPDTLADFGRFAEAVADQFQDNLSVALWASTAAQQADSMITARYAANGQPWFAAPQTPAWNFDNARGLAFFTPFVTNDVVDDDGVTHHYLPWQIRWYTDATYGGENPNPLRWTIDTQWDEVLESYWADDTSVETEACLPELPGVLQSGEVSAPRVTAPMTGTVTLGTPARPKGVIRTGAAVAGVQVRFTIQQGGQSVYTNTVAVDYLPAGAQVEVSASQDWSPAVIGPYILTLTIDPNDQILETNEGDNAVARSDQVLPSGPPRPIVTATVSGGLQLVGSNTVALDVQSSQSPATLFIQVYQYPATLTPTMQVVSPIPVYLKTFTHVTLPLSGWNFTIPAATLHPGPVVLHIWSATLNGPSVSPAIVTFNYAPPAASLDAGAAHYFLVNLNRDDTVHFGLTANSGDPNLFGWRPYNYDAPNWQGTAVGSDSLDIAPAPFTGEYLFEVYGQTTGSYTLAFTRNGAPGLRQTVSTADPNPAAYIPTARPYFVAPIPDMTAAPRYLVYLPRVAR